MLTILLKKKDAVKGAGGAGANMMNYFLTEKAFALLEKSYKFRQHDIVDLHRRNFTHPVIMPIETATIGTIHEVFSDFVPVKQYAVSREDGKQFYIDLYFPKQKIAVECYEDHHSHTVKYDKERGDYITKKLGCVFYIYRTYEEGFQMTTVLRDLIRLLLRN